MHFPPLSLLAVCSMGRFNKQLKSVFAGRQTKHGKSSLLTPSTDWSPPINLLTSPSNDLDRPLLPAINGRDSRIEEGGGGGERALKMFDPNHSPFLLLLPSPFPTILSPVAVNRNLLFPCPPTHPASQELSSPSSSLPSFNPMSRPTDRPTVCSSSSSLSRLYPHHPPTHRP